MKISDNDIDRVKEASEILDVVSDYFPLKKAGQNYRALCPFHHEKTASFMVNPVKQIYHCFGCRSGGNVFSFIMQYEKLAFPEAVKLLAGKSGIQLTISDNDRREEDKTEPIYKALEQACMLYQKRFPNSIAEDYIRKRGINDDTIVQFRLGYSPDVESWAFLLNEMKGKFDTWALEQAGLIRKSAKSEKYFDMFRGRLMFPIFNSTGRVVGFSARALDGSEPKYLNSPEGPLFSKGRLLYGMNFASKHIREKNKLIVVEGYTDVLNFHQSGIENSIGVMGTALTEEHVQMFEKRFPGLEMILCFDNDEGGIRAALDAGEKALGRISAKACLLPEGEDPASIMEKGKDIREYLNKSVSFFDFLIDEKKKGKNLDEFEGEAAFLREMGEVYKKMPQNMKGLFVEKISQKISKRIETIEQAFGKTHRDRAQPYRDARFEKRIFWERKFLAQLIAANSPETIKYFSDLDEQIFSSREAQAIFTYLI